ncbi:MAG: hypothetical protein HZA60_10950 [Deltaproteobacteria bacterium]|nr:hypothetical protein [Deltaproteobacteria bacterium]
MRKTAWGFLLLLLLWPAAAPVAGGAYTYVDIHPNGWAESYAVCVNGRGQVAGYGNNGSGVRGFLRSSAGSMEILPPGASAARVSWVNAFGEVAGTAVVDGRSRAFLYRDGTYLDPTPGWAFSEATYVGEDGAVTGAGEFGAYVSRNGVVEVLPGFTVVVGTNASGYVIGNGENTAMLYLPGRGYLDVSPPGTSFAVARGINESGLVALSSVQDGSEKGFVYSGGFYVFMTPPGWSSSAAMAINNFGQVAGYGESPAGRRSFLRTGSEYEELAFPGWTSTEAVSVNDLRQVAGSGKTESGETHAFLASPPDGVSGSNEGSGAATGASAGGGGGCSVAPGNAGTESAPTKALSLLTLFAPLVPLILCRRKL